MRAHNYFQCLKFSKFFVRFVMLLILAPALFDLIIAHHIKKQGYSRVASAIDCIDYVTGIAYGAAHSIQISKIRKLSMLYIFLAQVRFRINIIANLKCWGGKGCFIAVLSFLVRYMYVSIISV